MSKDLSRKDVVETFTEIYRTNHWQSNESRSGHGSDSIQTATIIKEISKLVKLYSIKSMLDIPCGDFNWMRQVELSGIHYIGADIVSELIEENQKLYTIEGNTSFTVKNLISDPLPKCDLILTRDCLVHLSNKDIAAAIKNIKSSGSRYLLTTTFTHRKFNKNIPTGNWRTLNLQKGPFYFHEPLLTINENCTEYENRFSDKSLGLWRIESLIVPTPFSIALNNFFVPFGILVNWVAKKINSKKQ